MSIPKAVIDSLSHYDYVECEQECSCQVCEDYRQKRDAYAVLLRAVETHNRSCMCDQCKAMRRAHTAERAADERWTLYCEMSFHASMNPELGEDAMEWMMGVLEDPARGDGWWEGRAPYYAISFWTWRFRRAMATAVTGVSGFFNAVAAVSGTLLPAVSGSL